MSRTINAAPRRYRAIVFMKRHQQTEDFSATQRCAIEGEYTEQEAWGIVFEMLRASPRWFVGGEVELVA